MSSIFKILFLSLLTLTVFSCKKENGEDSIRLIPEGYTGPVVIIFNQSDGTPVKYEDNKRVYEIPKSGILKTQFSKNTGFQINEFYYVSDKGKRTKIEYLSAPKDSSNSINNKKVYAYAEEYSGEGEGFNPEKGKYKIYPSISFYIGNLNNIEKSFKEKYDFLLSSQ